MSDFTPAFTSLHGLVYDAITFNSQDLWENWNLPNTAGLHQFASRVDFLNFSLFFALNLCWTSAVSPLSHHSVSKREKVLFYGIKWRRLSERLGEELDDSAKFVVHHSFRFVPVAQFPYLCGTTISEGEVFAFRRIQSCILIHHTQEILTEIRVPIVMK